MSSAPSERSLNEDPEDEREVRAETAPLTLLDVMSREYVSASDVQQLMLGACRTAEPEPVDSLLHSVASLSDPEALAAAKSASERPALRLLGKVERMAALHSADIFEDSLSQAARGIEAVVGVAGIEAVDFLWIGDEAVHSMLDVAIEHWQAAGVKYQAMERLDEKRQEDWNRVLEALEQPIGTNGMSQPLIEVDSFVDRQRGWNKEWTFNLRQEFNWGVATLATTLEHVGSVRDRSRQAIDLLESHLDIIAQYRTGISEATEEYWLLAGDVRPRDYAKQASASVDEKLSHIRHLSADLTCVEHEIATVHEAHARHGEHFKTYNDSGGCTVRDLVEERTSLEAQLQQLVRLKREALVRPESRLRELEEDRQAEIDRALKHSQAFLHSNTEMQQEAKDELEAVRTEFERQKELLQQLIEENLKKEQEAIREHEQHAQERAERERHRTDAVRRLLATADATLDELKGRIRKHQTEVHYTSDVVAPFYHGFGLALLNVQQDILPELEEKRRLPDGHARECLVRLFQYRGVLVSALITACNDIDKVLEACSVTHDFCKETSDPKRGLVENIVKELQDQHVQLLEEAAVARSSMEKHLAQWVGGPPDELWQALSQKLDDEELRDVRNVELPGPTLRSPRMLKQRPLVTFPGCPTSDLRAMCRGFHVPCKLPLLNYRAGSAGAAAAEMRRKQLLPPVVR